MIIKPKYRHVLVLSSTPITLDEAKYGLSKELMRMMGETSYSEANPRIMAQQGKTIIIKVKRGCERQLILALAFVKKLGEKKIGFYSIKTSGSIKSLSNYAKKENLI